MPQVVALAKTPTLADLVDEYGELARRIRMYAPDLDRAKEMRRQFAELYIEEDPAQEFSVEGKVYVLRISKRPMQRFVTAVGMRKLFKHLGQGQFLSKCTFPMKELDELKLEGIVTEERTGARKFESIPLSPARTV